MSVVQSAQPGAALTDVSRIFVRGLPPTLTDSDFKQHFAAVGAVTDTKLFAKRRIGYVGYQSAEQAQKAVKYFNKTFIRMSKLAVELAQPVTPTQTSKGSSQASVQSRTDVDSGSAELRGQKRKRDEKVPSAVAVRQPELATEKRLRVEPAEVDDSKQALVVGDDGRESEEQDNVAADQPHGTDADWMRSRTSRNLDLIDDGDEQPQRTLEPVGVTSRGSDQSDSQTAAVHNAAPDTDMDTVDATAEHGGDTSDDPRAKIRESGRLFLRNLTYQVSEGSLRDAFSKYASVSEVHVPTDTKNGVAKGFAFIMFEDPEEAVRAWEELDGTTLNGRLVHILPAAGKRNTALDDFALSKLPLKQQQLVKRRRETASSTFNWNALYMNADAVISSVADRLGVDKADLLDVTSADAAIRQAHAETHVIQETKAYFKSHGVNLDAFGKSKRGDTAILVKNFPYDVKADELKVMFEQHGKLKRFLMPPSGTIAIMEFRDAPAARSAYASLAYRRIKGSMLFLEKAPADLFTGESEDIAPVQPFTVAGKSQANAGDLLRADDIPDDAPTATLFVRNLNFSTTTNRLDEVFRPLEGFLSARVKTKTDAKRLGEILSMGFGFLEFRNKAQAEKAQLAMDGYNLDGHVLQIRASHKGHDSAEERKRADAAKKNAAKRAKLVIKNLPFEATKKDVRALLAPYGQLRSVRVPRKIGQSTRGFAFAEFTTPKEAENAMDALRDTHLLGRRLAIDYAAEDPDDAEEEIERMQSKMGSQLNKVAVQNLMGGGRKKFSVQDREENDA